MLIYKIVVLKDIKSLYNEDKKANLNLLFGKKETHYGQAINGTEST